VKKVYIEEEKIKEWVCIVVVGRNRWVNKMEEVRK
jgi:hypothetical protein